MIQYAKLRVKMPAGYTVADLEKQMKEIGIEVEITGVYIQLIGVDVPESFRLKEN